MVDPTFLAQVEESIKAQLEDVATLTTAANKHPYYKYVSMTLLTMDLAYKFYYRYNFKWTKSVQDAILTVLLDGWLGGNLVGEGKVGRLLTLEEIGQLFKGEFTPLIWKHETEIDSFNPVPVNLKDRDEFHITIEEYLLAIPSLTDELSRLAVNSVTLGDHELAVKISNFVKDIHAGFQLLNLKNDQLRRKSDSIKYHVKKVEDVVYDLSLRNLIPNSTGS